MIEFTNAILTQALLFLPLAFGISISYNILRATDMTIDGSFVLGAAVFARLITLGFTAYFSAFFAIFAGAFAGLLSASIQRGGRVDPLLAGILATFILSSLNLYILGKPNISLLSEHTLISSAFEKSEMFGFVLISIYSLLFCFVFFLLIKSRFGLQLRAFGDNPILFKRIGKPIELFRLAGFAITNMLSAGAGCLTAQAIGYADIGMGLGMTLTGIGAIIIGQQIFARVHVKKIYRVGAEFIACLLGVIIYFALLNLLLRIGIDPLYLKMILGLLLIFFLRSAMKPILLETQP